MHPDISQAVAEHQIADARRAADGRRLAAEINRDGADNSSRLLAILLTCAHASPQVASWVSIGELAELELASRDVAEQHPVVVLLGGQSGVGKTRLVREFERRMTESDEDEVVVLRGEAVEQAHGELPYAPLIGALRPLVRGRATALGALSRAARAQLAALLPGLDEEPAAPDRDDSPAQPRLFEALLELIDLLSEDHVLVLTLEDLHWADRSTRTFIDFLARSLRRERVMLLLSYRTDGSTAATRCGRCCPRSSSVWSRCGGSSWLRSTASS